MIEITNISYAYPAVDGKAAALDSVTAQIRNGAMTAVIGRSGSGKSTLAEIIAGITEPDTGTVIIDGIPAKNTDGIGLVFQYPEYQLFEDTVYEDIAYGPKNQGLSGDELRERVELTAAEVGLDPHLLSLAPFELSGGEKRLAAIAGILAMKPSVLILDEPAAGLDPTGRARIFEILHRLLSADPKMTIIFITHSMDDAADHADNIIMLNGGRVAATGTPREILSNADLLTECGLDVPQTVKLTSGLREVGINTEGAFTADEIYAELFRFLERRSDNAS